jgi:tRNA(fMet)-specific endonuclease VapC
VIYFFKGRGQVAQNLLHTPPSEIALSTISLYELWVGITRSAQPERNCSQLNELIKLITLLPFDEAAAQSAAEIRRHLEQIGFPIGTLDTLIAGVALSRNLTLVTHNLSEFQRVPNLSLEDWY